MPTHDDIITIRRAFFNEIVAAFNLFNVARHAWAGGDEPVIVELSRDGFDKITNTGATVRHVAVVVEDSPALFNSGKTPLDERKITGSVGVRVNLTHGLIARVFKDKSATVSNGYQVISICDADVRTLVACGLGLTPDDSDRPMGVPHEVTKATAQHPSRYATSFRDEPAASYTFNNSRAEVREDGSVKFFSGTQDTVLTAEQIHRLSNDLKVNGFEPGFQPEATWTTYPKAIPGDTAECPFDIPVIVSAKSSKSTLITQADFPAGKRFVRFVYTLEQVKAAPVLTMGHAVSQELDIPVKRPSYHPNVTVKGMADYLKPTSFTNEELAASAFPATSLTGCRCSVCGQWFENLDLVLTHYCPPFKGRNFPEPLSFRYLGMRLDRRTEESGAMAYSQNWLLDQWTNALAGETGEACNMVKKMNRPGNTIKPLDVGRELADVVIYAHFAAKKLGLRLEDCIRLKFNEVSDRVGSTIKL